MKAQFNPFVLALAASLLGGQTHAADVTKANNTSALNLGTSWSLGTAPGSADVAVWDNTVSAANSTNLGGALSWQGIRIANPVGLVTINHSAATTLTLGSAGIELSAATQNLTFGANAGLVIGADQTWNIARGRTLTLGRATTGSGNLNLTASGSSGLALINMGAISSSGYTGQITVGANVQIGSTATGAWLGTQAVKLNGGEVALNPSASVGWNNGFEVTAGTTTSAIVNNATSTGAIRSIILNGVISGGGSGSVLTFRNTGYMPFDGTTGSKGFIITRDSTFEGTIRVENTHATYGSFLRVGGGNATTTDGRNLASGGNNGSLHANADIVLDNARSVLLLMRNDAHTFGNDISGTGELWVGHSTLADTTTDNQTVNLTGTNTHTGATKVLSGSLLLNGTLTSSVSVSEGARIGGSTGTNTGGLTTAANSALLLTGGATTAATTFNGVTFSGTTLVEFGSAPVAGTVYDVVTYGVGGVTGSANLTKITRGTFADVTASQKITFTAGASSTRTWNIGSGTWNRLGTLQNWQQDDQVFYDLDSAVFGDIAADTTIAKDGTVRPAGVVVSNAANTYTFDGSGTIGGITGLTKSGGGTLVLATANAYTGTTTINGGTVRLGATGALGAASAPVVIHSGGTLDTAGQQLGARAITLAGGKITNSGVTQSNTLVGGTFTVTADSRIGGVNRWDIRGTGAVVTINSGVTLTKEDSNLIYLNVSGTSIINDGLIDITGGELGIWANPISGSGTFRVNSGGTLRLESTTNNPLALTLNGGTLYGNSTSATQSGPVTVQADSVLNSTVSTAISGDIGETGGAHVLTKIGSSEFSLLGTNSFSGTYNIQVGKIGGAGATSLNGQPNVSIAAGAFFSLGTGFDGGTATIGNLAGAGTVDTAFGGSNATRTLQVTQTTDAVFSGKLVDASGSRILALAKAGSAKLTLSGTNTYTGTTAVSAGTLLVTGALGNTPVTVGANGTIGGTGTLGGVLILETGANLDLTGAMLGLNSAGILTVAAGKTITLTDFNFTNIIGWDWLGADPGTYTLISGGDAVTLGGTTPNVTTPFDFGNGKQGYFQQGSLQAVIIPEPATALLGGLGLLALLRRRR